ncbi:MAG: aldehyde dehydrogenase [Verrucomicrobia bacterium]|nr:aldehyde dehydrogenase [Verrucomicrobiota bacterium]
MGALHIPILRWGQAHESLETEELFHFHTGEPLAKMSQASLGLLAKDLRHAQRARDMLREIPVRELIARMAKAADLFKNAALPLGDGEQSADDFIRQQSGTTGLPEHLCRANLEKNYFVLANAGRILDALTRGLAPDILTRGHGVESRGVIASFQVQSPVLGMVLPSNSPGVHTLWSPVVGMQLGLVLKPGSQEFWTPYRIAAAFAGAGIPREVVGIYPGHVEVGLEIVNGCRRTFIFGNAETVKHHEGNPRVQVHGPGYSKILLGDDAVDDWEKSLDLMVESVLANAGRGCINCSSIWASRHTRAIAQALAERLGPVEVKPPDDPNAALAAFTIPGRARAIHASILEKLREDGAEDMTAKFGPRLVETERAGYLRPWVIRGNSPDHPLANTEYMFPFVTVVECPQAQVLVKIGHTLVGTAISEDPDWQRELLDAPQIDRLNFGLIPTTRINPLQPHEGNIFHFLFRSRALQVDADKARRRSSNNLSGH